MQQSPVEILSSAIKFVDDGKIALAIEVSVDSVASPTGKEEGS
jgi:hypothetical protein